MGISDLCHTPENEAGDCRSVYDCPSVLSQFQGQLTRQTTNYLRSLQCNNGFGRYPHVCCIVNNNYEQQFGFNSQRNRHPSAWLNSANSQSNRNIIPGLGACGLTSLAHRIYGGDSTNLDDYPWMALLEYQTRMYFFLSILNSI